MNRTSIPNTFRSRFAIALMLALSSPGQAGTTETETENLDFRILPAPGKVVIDGNANDWDLSGSIFICSAVETLRDQFAAWQSAMYDSDNLYLLARWNDKTPMNNPGLCGSDLGFQGDSLQVRTIVSPVGSVDIKADMAKTGQRTTHITAWSGRDGTDIIDLAYGTKLDEGIVKDAKQQGARQAFVRNQDGSGYFQEISIPWKLLTSDGHAPEAGDTIVMTFEPNFSTEAKMRVTTKDLFRPGVKPDRVFSFGAFDRWGLAKVEASGNIPPLPLRLSDGRTFPVSLVAGVPTIDWTGIVKDDKLKGFAPITLQMPEDGYVSLIVKDANGQVVRHLLNAKFMSQGVHEVLWDGLTTFSDLKPGEPAPAGDYRWEAIWHKGLGLKLVGWACNAGIAPFDSPRGNWGGDMGGPCAVDSDSQHIYLGWSAAEAGQALVCTDFAGKVQWRHKRGGFGGASLVAVDQAMVFVYDSGQGNMLYRLDSAKGAYVNWQGSGEATLALGPLLAPFKPNTAKEEPAASGLAAKDGKIFISYGALNAPWNRMQASGNVMLVLDAATGDLLKSLPVENPGDLKTGADGKLYLIHGNSQISTIDPLTGALSTVVTGLNDARCVAVDRDGNIYAGMGDTENQVKVFDKSGKFIRAIGKMGGRGLLGPWEPTGMRFVSGIKIDELGKLWVMENDTKPRRISVWDAQTGAFEKELFGPTDYGAGGGAICPSDPLTLIGHGCEWKLDKDTGKASCVAVISRGGWSNARFGTGKDGRVYAAVGDKWLNGRSTVSIFERIAEGNWKLRASLAPNDDQRMRIWSDRNGDEQEQADEIKTPKALLEGWIDGWYLYFNQSMTFAGSQYRIDVTGWTDCGAPEYDLTNPVKLPAPDDVGQRGGMGAQRSMVTQDGNYVIYNGLYGAEHSDFPCYDVRTGQKISAYPNNYVGVHGGHLAPPARDGLIRGAYDIVGTVPMPTPLDNLFVIATDKGEWHLLSSSGYYVGHLFEGDPMKIKWPDAAVPGADMSKVPPGMGSEDFGGSIMLADDGNLYVQAGKTAFINSKVTGLATVKPLGSGTLKISQDDMLLAQNFKIGYLRMADAVKPAEVRRKTVEFTGDPGKDFDSAPITYGTAPSGIQTWLCHDDDVLHVAWQVEDKTPWVNGATGFENLYASGDTVDLQLATDPSADPRRNDAAAGDLRLSIGQLQGSNTAVIYRKVADEQSPKTFFSGTSKGGYTMEYVKQLASVSLTVKLLGDTGYIVEAAIPIKELGLHLKPGLKLHGDFGATYGDPVGKDTNLRVFWSNKATGIVADEVEELKMQPAMWGNLDFE